MKFILNYKIFESNTKYWYHGTDANFIEFKDVDDKTKPTSKFGIWFTDDKNFAELFGNNIIIAELSFKNPYIVTAEKWDSIKMRYHDDPIFFNNFKNKLINEGYDSFFVSSQKTTLGNQNVYIPNIIAVFSKEQIRIVK